MGEHTKGPWEFPGNVETDDGHPCVVDSDGLVVCIGLDDGKTEQEVDFNLDLIAAAPDLLKVVEAFVEETVDYMTINNLGDPEQKHNVRWAREVIAKAKGQAA